MKISENKLKCIKKIVFFLELQGPFNAAMMYDNKKSCCQISEVMLKSLITVMPRLRTPLE